MSLNQSDTLISPGEKKRVYRLTEIASNGSDISTYTVPSGKTFLINSVHSSGTQLGEISTWKVDTSVISLVDNGDFSNNTEVAQWAAVTGNFTVPSPDSSPVQVFNGIASMRWIYSGSTTALARKQTLSTPIDMTTFRFIRARFFNDAVSATTRTISIILTSTLGGTRTYSLSGTIGTAPFSNNTWMTLTADMLVEPTLSSGNFDPQSVNGITLQMVDGQNRSGTIYWDYVTLETSTVLLEKGLFPINTSSPEMTNTFVDQVLENQVLVTVIKNLSNQKGEFTAIIKGLLV